MRNIFKPGSVFGVKKYRYTKNAVVIPMTRTLFVHCIAGRRLATR